jgi:carbonic anhydrase
MKSFADNTTSINISLSHFLGKYNEMGYWYYLGSATIPPCNDGKLYWIVLKQIFSMSKEQRDFFYEMFNNENEIIDGNWRNIQDSTNNTVKFYPGYQQ